MRPALVQDVKKRKKDIQVARIVKDVMTKKSEQVFDLFVAQHKQNEGYEGDLKNFFFVSGDRIQKNF